MTLLASVVLLALASAAAQAQTGPTVVTIGVRAIVADRPDNPQGLLGGRGAGKVIEGDGFFDQCLTRANVVQPVPPTATYSWHFSGRIVTQTERDAVVELDWQRTRADGKPVSGIGGSKTITLMSGDRVAIDEVATNLTPGCAPRRLALEVSFAPAGPPTFTVFAPGPDPRGAGPGTGGDAPPLPRLSFVLALTLVSTAPDSAQPLSVRIGSGGASVRFRPVRIPMDGGSLGVTYVASLQYTTPNQANRGFQIFVEPQLAFTPAGAAAPDRSSTGPRATFARPIPEPNEELTFPLPPLTSPDGQTVPSRFVLKMRMTPTE